jgi:hypothetical protein
LWDIDVSLYLADETSVSSNYTARTACGDLVIKLGEWLDKAALEGLFAYTKTLFSGEGASWQKQEAALFLFNAILNDFQDCEKSIPPEIANAYLELVTYAINRQDEAMLRARGYLVAGALAQIYPPALNLLDNVIDAITRDDSELVQVAGVKAVEGFIRGGVPVDRQVPIIVAIQRFLEAKDLSELEDADDLLVTLLDTLRTTISMDTRIAIQPDSKAVDLLFLIAKHGAANFHVTLIVCETFEDIARTFKDNEGPLKDMEHPRLYAALCSKVLPSITGTFDVANLTQDDPLVTVCPRGFSWYHLLILLCSWPPISCRFSSSTVPSPCPRVLLPLPSRNCITS